MKDNNCIFCKLANGEIPTATLYEDEDFRVILEHYANLYELEESLAGKAMILAKKMVAKMTDVLGCDGYNLVQNNGECAGQTVFHFHLHLIPRYKDDRVGLGWKLNELTETDREDILSKM